ncbi:hypothetical protein DFH09DRAFT_1367392 [Mycena vulgaris]|nr:hypothetical protein DFH09DRAFT_1367392 [Mycena vulgaris]
MTDLPAEVWTQIFDLAADEDFIFQHGLPTSMTESEWFKDYFGDRALRSPQDSLHLLQRTSYLTKKARNALMMTISHLTALQAIVRTSKQFRGLAYESLFRFLFFNDPARLLTLCGVLESSSAAATTATASLGWWTRRIHLTRFYANTTREVSPESLQGALIRIIRHCPNLEIFIIDWPMNDSTFGPLADNLVTFTSQSLRTLHIIVPSIALPKIIRTLKALPYISAAHIELEVTRGWVTPDDTSDVAHPHSLDRSHLKLPRLEQLSLGGYPQRFLREATGWDLPSVRHFSLHCETRLFGLPDIPAFVAAHGVHLVSLDLYSLPSAPMPLSLILAACPSLTSLAFNADWRIVLPEDTDADVDTPSLKHAGLTSIGLHGLAYAFGVGDAVGAPPLARTITIANDRNLTLLCDRARFPALRRIRMLSRGLLGELDRANGPSAEGGGAERWERWLGECRRAGIRLEDCTGGLLGEPATGGSPDLQRRPGGTGGSLSGKLMFRR